MITAIFLIAYCVYVFLYVIALTLSAYANIRFINWYIDYISMALVILMAISGLGAMISAIIGELL